MAGIDLFPTWIGKTLVVDAVFDRAYKSVSDKQRALLKTALFWLWERNAPLEVVSKSTKVVLRSGLRAVCWSEPRPAIVLFLDDAEVSPIRLLAALFPALVAGVPEILVACLGRLSSAASALLTALELAGVDRVAQLSNHQGLRLLKYLTQNTPSCAILALGGVACSTAIWRGCLNQPLGLWLDQPNDLDLEALTFAQPDAILEAWGPGAHNLSMPVVRRSGNFKTFLRQNYHAVYVSEPRHKACIGHIPLILGPGCESYWLWLDLKPSLFLSTSTAWSLHSERS